MKYFKKQLMKEKKKKELNPKNAIEHIYFCV